MRRRRPQEGIETMDAEHRTRHILEVIHGPAGPKRANDALKRLDEDDAFDVEMDLLVETQRRTDPAFDAMVGELFEVRHKERGPVREYDPTCFLDAACSCSACICMRRIEANERNTDA